MRVNIENHSADDQQQGCNEQEITGLTDNEKRYEQKYGTGQDQCHTDMPNVLFQKYTHLCIVLEKFLLSEFGGLITRIQE